MGGGGDKKDSGPAVKDALLLNVLSEYDAIPGSKLVECTVMAQIKAEQGNEERRAPVTICAAIDRRYFVCINIIIIMVLADILDIHTKCMGV